MCTKLYHSPTQEHNSMKSVCGIAVLALLIVIPLSLWSEEDGAAVYKAKCSACHGAQGEGKPAAKLPALKGTSMTVDQLVNLISKGNSEGKVHVKPVQDLSAEQARAVAAHVKTLE